MSEPTAQPRKSCHLLWHVTHRCNRNCRHREEGSLPETATFCADPRRQRWRNFKLVVIDVLDFPRPVRVFMHLVEEQIPAPTFNERVCKLHQPVLGEPDVVQTHIKRPCVSGQRRFAAAQLIICGVRGAGHVCPEHYVIRATTGRVKGHRRLEQVDGGWGHQTQRFQFVFARRNSTLRRMRIWR